VVGKFTLGLLGGRSAPEGQAGGAARRPFAPTWKSLSRIPTPQWLRDEKFGIYTHWGVYSVPAVGPNESKPSSRAAIGG
jgi:alpha-L-fucosidase